MTFVFLRVARPKVLGNHWTYFCDADVPFQRITESSLFEADMAPKDRTGITVEISCNPGDEIWSLDDEALLNLTADGFEHLGLLGRDEIVGYDVLRIPEAYPIQRQGFALHVEELLAALRPIDNLVTLGREGLFRYCNMDECITMALDIAPRIIAGERSIHHLRQGTWKGVGVTDA